VPVHKLFDLYFTYSLYEQSVCLKVLYCAFSHLMFLQDSNNLLFATRRNVRSAMAKHCDQQIKSRRTLFRKINFPAVGNHRTTARCRSVRNLLPGREGPRWNCSKIAILLMDLPRFPLCGKSHSWPRARFHDSKTVCTVSAKVSISFSIISKLLRSKIPKQ